MLSRDISLILIIFHGCQSLNERGGDRILITVHLHICLLNFEKNAFEKCHNTRKDGVLQMNNIFSLLGKDKQ